MVFVVVAGGVVAKMTTLFVKFMGRTTEVEDKRIQGGMLS